MNTTFSEIKLFQVKPEKAEAFEALIKELSALQRERAGCIGIKYMQRFYTIDGVELGEPPRKLTKVVKCVKYFSYWEFDSKENYGKATKWFFDEYYKTVAKLLIMPFDIYCGDSLV